MPERWVSATRFCPDSNILIERVLRGTRFAARVDFFCDTSKQFETTSIILPAVHKEVTGKIRFCAEFFVNGCRQFRKVVSDSLAKPLREIPAGPEIIPIIRSSATEVRRRMVSGFMQGTRERASQSVSEVETALVQSMYSHNRAGKSRNLASVFDDTELKMRGPYTEYNDRYGDLIVEIRGLAISSDKMHSPSPTMDQTLLNECQVANDADRVILAQALCFMFTFNLWTAVVTNDYTDLLANKRRIEERSLLLVCDPLYAFEEVKERHHAGLSPIQVANQRDLDYRALVQVPVPPQRIV